MSYKTMLIYLFFTAVQSEVYSDDLEALKSRIKSSKVATHRTKDLNRIVVSFFDLDRVIYVYGPLSDATAFYIGLNCEFAYWTNHKLHKTIERVPWFYQHRFQHTYEELSGTAAKDVIENLEHITGITKRFENILFNFVDKYTYASLLETSFLKALVSLRFHVARVQRLYGRGESLDGERTSKNEKFNVLLITGILEAMNAVQAFVTYNCDVRTGRYLNNHFFGMSAVNRNKYLRTNDVLVTKLLLNVKEHVRIETWSELCDADQMTLERHLLRKNAVSTALSELKFVIDGSPVKFARILKKVTGVTTSLEIIYWYQTIVYNAIVKLICAKIKPIANTLSVVYDEIGRAFGTLWRFFFPAVNLPRKLAYYFKCLARKRGLAPYETRGLSEAVGAYLTETQGAGRTPRMPVVTIIVPGGVTDRDGVTGLQDFLSAVANGADDYGCFARLFGLLNHEFGRYYAVHVFDSDAVNAFVNEEIKQRAKTSAAAAARIDAASVDETCAFLANVYRCYFESDVALSSYVRAKNSEFPPDGRVSNVGGGANLAGTYLRSVASVHPAPAVRRAALNLNAVADLLLDDAYDDATSYDSASRVSSAGYAELNARGLRESCTPPAREHYLLHGDVNLDAVGSHGRQRDEEILGFRAKLARYSDEKTTPSLRQLRGVYRDELRPGGRFDEYARAVTVYWKGEKWTVGDVFLSVTRAVPSPAYAFALYHAFFAFAAAAIYYETAIAMKEADRVTGGTSVQPLITRFQRIDADLFPRAFAAFVSCYNDTWTRYYDKTINMSKRYPNVGYESALDEQLKELSALGAFVDLGAEKNVRTAAKTTAHASSSSSDLYFKKLYAAKEPIMDSVARVNALLNELRDFFD